MSRASEKYSEMMNQILGKKDEIVNGKYPIRLSTWHLRDKPKKAVNLDAVDDLFSDDLTLKKLRDPRRKKEKEYIAKNIVVSGTSKEIWRMTTSDNYLFQVFSDVFGKSKAAKKIKEGKIEVVRVELDSEILGWGVGQLSPELLFDY